MHTSSHVILLTLSLLVAVTHALHIQHPLNADLAADGPFDESFNAFVEDILDRLHVPGLSIAVVDDGIVYSKVTGSPLLSTIPS